MKTHCLIIIPVLLLINGSPLFSQNISTRDAFSYHITKTERPIKIDGIISNVVEHVMTHEIGHSVGLRHTEYFNRSISCGQGGNEGDGDVGAVHIPGTPTSADLYSIMLACFSSSEDGEFGQYDVTALQYLY